MSLVLPGVPAAGRSATDSCPPVPPAAGTPGRGATGADPPPPSRVTLSQARRSGPRFQSARFPAVEPSGLPLVGHPGGAVVVRVALRAVEPGRQAGVGELLFRR